MKPTDYPYADECTHCLLERLISPRLSSEIPLGEEAASGPTGSGKPSLSGRDEEVQCLAASGATRTDCRYCINPYRLRTLCMYFVAQLQPGLSAHGSMCMQRRTATAGRSALPTQQRQTDTIASSFWRRTGQERREGETCSRRQLAYRRRAISIGCSSPWTHRCVAAETITTRTTHLTTARLHRHASPSCQTRTLFGLACTWDRTLLARAGMMDGSGRETAPERGSPASTYIRSRDCPESSQCLDPG